jgi:hypothetical protein
MISIDMIYLLLPQALTAVPLGSANSKEDRKRVVVRRTRATIFAQIPHRRGMTEMAH